MLPNLIDFIKEHTNINYCIFQIFNLIIIYSLINGVDRSI